jgi:hypothetical protein
MLILNNELNLLLVLDQMVVFVHLTLSTVACCLILGNVSLFAWVSPRIDSLYIL